MRDTKTCQEKNTTKTPRRVARGGGGITNRQGCNTLRLLHIQIKNCLAFFFSFLLDFAAIGTAFSGDIITKTLFHKTGIFLVKHSAKRLHNVLHIDDVISVHILVRGEVFDQIGNLNDFIFGDHFFLSLFLYCKNRLFFIFCQLSFLRFGIVLHVGRAIRTRRLAVAIRTVAVSPLDFFGKAGFKPPDISQCMIVRCVFAVCCHLSSLGFVLLLYAHFAHFFSSLTSYLSMYRIAQRGILSMVFIKKINYFHTISGAKGYFI